ncbi:hypothetical protein [Piscinibacter sp.]|uniref:hypothetical protein n=1 Tax=Piscinibacter sp. TaxID=1903157 RepID=UPI002CBC26D1|nr:hypothetical protein [Albitalea sp.]HUG25321.1 hypothetical protein [Albitalea sp.]
MQTAYRLGPAPPAALCAPADPRVVLWPAIVIALVLCTMSLGARAEPETPAGERTVVPGADRPALSAELTAFHGRIPPVESGVQALDGRPVTELAGVDYRLWLSSGRAGLAIGVGTVSLVMPQLHDAADTPRRLGATAPTVTVGLRYRMSPRSAVYADAAGVHGFGADVHAAQINTRVGLEWKPATSRFGFEHRSFGLQLDSGYRLSLRARSGGLALYLRGKF